MPWRLARYCPRSRQELPVIAGWNSCPTQGVLLAGFAQTAFDSQTASGVYSM
jgi:hypothetical protein